MRGRTTANNRNLWATPNEPRRAVVEATLTCLVQQALRMDPHLGAVFCFRGRKGHVLKILAHDGQGFALFTKRLDAGHFVWPSAKERIAVSLSKADLALLLDGVDWRAPSRTLRPRMAG